MRTYKHADVRHYWNDGMGALLCSRCSVILMYGHVFKDFEYYCPTCEFHMKHVHGTVLKAAVPPEVNGPLIPWSEDEWWRTYYTRFGTAWWAEELRHAERVLPQAHCSVCGGYGGHTFGCPVLNIKGDVIDGSARQIDEPPEAQRKEAVDDDRFERSEQTDKPTTQDYLDSLALVDALWWFIENVPPDAKDSSELFFYLRERVRKEQRS